MSTSIPTRFGAVRGTRNGGGSNYFFFRQGDDLLITRPGGEFVTMFPGAGSNAWFKGAEVFPH
jgi:ferredoxin-NADP reductase